MPSSRWLKAVPSSDPGPEATTPPASTPNVSMNDLRRLQEAKRKKAEEESAGENNNDDLNRQPAASSQPREQPRDGPESNQPVASSQPVLSSQPTTSHQVKPSLSLLASLPEIKGDARLPHRYTDHLCKLLNPYEQAVYLQLYRLSWGWGKETCFISNPRLSERSNVPLSTMKRVVVSLIDKGLVEKTGHTNGFGKDQGVEYRVPAVSWQPAQSSQPGESKQPAAGSNKIKNTQINTHTQGVNVGSSFSLEECRRYAEHLQASGQGINNPGGYATTIHRTGEVDALIEEFLNPPAAVAVVDSSLCPDCKGSGFYYPTGLAGGVAKCRHAQLVNRES
jgi:hypothetical protein